MTEPFADFSVDTGLSQLDLTRTYSSNDWAYAGGPAGVFGRGWHHDWEAWLSCSGSKCKVVRGLLSTLQFKLTGTAPSLDGLETWQIYQPWSNELFKDDHQNVLVRRPNGEWIVYLTDGRELHFATACDACGSPGSDPFCQDATLGGRARLVQVADARGNVVQVSYDRPGGVLMALADRLGHSLQLKNPSACGNGLASSLQYDGMTVANYSYSGPDLVQTADAAGAVLRSYAYDMSGTQRLVTVKNQAGDLVASFSYDAAGRATGVIDGSSSVSVNYDAPGGIQVAEFYGNTSTISVRKLDGDGHATSISDGCACGPARTYQWTDRRLTCSLDALGHATNQTFDALGRLQRRVERAGSSCSLPPSLPAGSRDERYAYGVVRTISQGINLELNILTSQTRPSALKASDQVGESYDYNQAPNATLDPAGYACTEAPLPVGSVLCRQISSGNVKLSGNPNPILERYATFFSYDRRGRLVRTYGPVKLGSSSASDVPPIEERTYWPDDESLARRGRLREVKRYPSPTAVPLVTSYDYDAFGVFQVTDPNGAVTTIVKDSRGRPTFVVTAAGSRETRYHDGLSPQLQVWPSGATVRSSYDSQGRVVSVEYLSTDPEAAGASPTLGWSEHYRYDAASNRVHAERRDGAGAVTWQQDRAYDVQHRLIWESNPEDPSAAKTWSYDASGFLTGTTDEEGRGTVFTPDELNRVSKVRRTGPAGQGLDIATYTYRTHADTLARVDSPNSPAPAGSVGAGTVNYTSDDFGRLAYLVGTAGGSFANTYDARGNLLKREHEGIAAETTTYMYDGLDRILSRSTAGTVYSFSYDAPPYQGRLTSIQEPDRKVTFTYDAAGRLASEAVQENGVATPLLTSYGYDADGALRQVTYPSGLQIQYDRDPAARQIVRVSNVSDGTGYATGAIHYPGGPLRALTFGNGLTLSQVINRRYEPVSIASGPLSLGYTPSPAGDLSAMVDNASNVSRSFTYDFLDRLTDSPSWLSYRYDNAGNRTSETLDTVQATYEYDINGGNRVYSRKVAGVQTHAFAYDDDRFLAGIGMYTVSGGYGTAACFRHDALGRMVLYGYRSTGLAPGYKACTADSEVRQVIARFKYDSRNRRVAAWSAATNQWTYVVSDTAGNPLSELVKTDDPQNPWRKYRDYVWLDGKPLAQIEYPGPAGSEQGYVYYYHLDHIGLPRALTNQAGQTVWSATARPYGDIVENTTTDPLSNRVVVTNLRLPGQYDERLLGSLGLQGPYYNWNRWYLPGVGRYLELDPWAMMGPFNGPYGPDWYNYANGNPLRYTDRTGLAYDGGPATPGEGGGREACSFYDEECFRKNGKCPPQNDPYPCEAGKCCRKFDESDQARCTRKCLIAEEQDCSLLGNGRWVCRMRAHYKCYMTCGFSGSLANISWSCIRTGLSF